MTESEKITRKKRIDAKLKSSLLNWEIIHNNKVEDTSLLKRHAVEEFPTATGPADYALFVEGKLLGIIEAKKIAVGAENVLERDYNLDITWLKDENLEDPNSLPEPQVLAADVITELNACVDELQEILTLIEAPGCGDDFGTGREDVQ